MTRIPYKKDIILSSQALALHTFLNHLASDQFVGQCFNGRLPKLNKDIFALTISNVVIFTATISAKKTVVILPKETDNLKSFLKP